MLINKISFYPAGIYLLEVNNRDNNQWRRSGVCIVSLEHISPFILLFILLNLNINCQLGIDCPFNCYKYEKLENGLANNQ